MLQKRLRAWSSHCIPRGDGPGLPSEQEQPAAPSLRHPARPFTYPGPPSASGKPLGWFPPSLASSPWSLVRICTGRRGPSYLFLAMQRTWGKGRKRRGGCRSCARPRPPAASPGRPAMGCNAGQGASHRPRSSSPAQTPQADWRGDERGFLAGRDTGASATRPWAGVI